MMFTKRKTSQVLTVVFICTVAVGFYTIYMINPTKQDKDRAVQSSGVRTAKGGTDTKAGRGPVKIDAGPVNRIGTGNAKVGTIEKSGIDTNFIDLDKMDAKELLNRTAIVTGVSQNHLEESKFMIGSVQTFLPQKKIIMYDLGLTPGGVKEVKRLCNVELRSFNFSKYPPHVKTFDKYAWKSLIVRDTLEEFGVVFWCDASARIRKDILVLFPILKQQKGFMPYVEQYGSSYMLARTQPKMFQELHVDIGKFAKDGGNSVCIASNRILFVRTPLIQSTIIKPWAECSLREECIAPAGSVQPLKQNKPDRHTHRGDQAALALIVYRDLKGLLIRDTAQPKFIDEVVGVMRYPKGQHKAKYCAKKNTT